MTAATGNTGHHVGVISGGTAALALPQPATHSAGMLAIIPEPSAPPEGAAL